MLCITVIFSAPPAQAEGVEENETVEGMELNAFILSHVFWPTFREEKLKLPDFIQK